MICEQNVGALFTTSGNDVWRLVGVCALPSATLLNLETGERRGGAIGSPLLGDFKLLLPAKLKAEGSAT